MIRPAVIADIEAVTAVVEAAGQTWVAEQDGAIAGILVLEEVPDGLPLDNVAVRPDCHGKGLGRSLIAFAEAEARRRGRPTIRLYTHALRRLSRVASEE